MSQHSTEERYPRDRFDDVERYTTQQGAHRKEFPAPKGSGHLNSIILAGGVALAIGVGSFLWLAPSDPLKLSSSAAEETVSAPADEPEEPAATDEPVDDEETLEAPEPVEEEPSEEPEPSAEPSEPEESADFDEPEEDVSEEPTEPVDYSVPIGVYNASTIQGYAAQVAQDLGGAGYNVPIADNWTGRVPSQTVVYYSSNEATAVAVANEVGAVAIYEPSVDGVLVVLTGS